MAGSTGSSAPPTAARDAVDSPAEAAPTYPCHLRDDFLSPAERSFYHVLRHTVGQTAMICVKVSLGDLVYPKTGRRADNQAYRNKINRKHLEGTGSVQWEEE